MTEDEKKYLMQLAGELQKIKYEIEAINQRLPSKVRLINSLDELKLQLVKDRENASKILKELS